MSEARYVRDADGMNGIKLGDRVRLTDEGKEWFDEGAPYLRAGAAGVVVGWTDYQIGVRWDDFEDYEDDGIDDDFHWMDDSHISLTLVSQAEVYAAIASIQRGSDV